MNKEVNKIIYKLNIARLIYDLILDPNECEELYQYIISLQEENKYLKGKEVK